VRSAVGGGVAGVSGGGGRWWNGEGRGGRGGRQAVGRTKRPKELGECQVAAQPSVQCRHVSVACVAVCVTCGGVTGWEFAHLLAVGNVRKPADAGMEGNPGVAEPVQTGGWGRAGAGGAAARRVDSRVR